MKIELRKPLLSDAKRFYEILDHPEFCYSPAKPNSVEDEKEFLRGAIRRMKGKEEYYFSILADGEHVGGASIEFAGTLDHVCEIGYFVAREHWDKGIASETVKLLEKFIADNLDVVRIEITTAKENVASRKVAVKSGYKKEGLMKKYLKVCEKYYDCYLYAKILNG